MVSRTHGAMQSSPHGAAARRQWMMPSCLFLLALVVAAEYFVTPDMNANSATSYREEVILNNAFNAHPPAYASLRSRSTDKVKLTAGAAAASAGKCKGQSAPNGGGASASTSVPVLYNLQTKLGVSYGAGHWFHIAENFMAAHSAMRAAGGTGSSASTIYFNFDEQQFSAELNPVTRFLVAAGAVQGRARQEGDEEKWGGETLTLHFLHIPTEYVSPPALRMQLEEAEQSGKEMGPDGVTANVGQGQPPPPPILVQLPPENKIKDHRIVELTLGPVKGTAGSGSGSDSDSGSQVSLQPRTVERFGAREVTAAESSAHGGACVEYRGSFGGKWPTLQRGHWFENPGDSAAFRGKVKDMCPADPALLQKQHLQRGERRRKMVVFQRDLSRQFINTDISVELLRSKFPQSEWEITVLVHDPNISPCYLAHVLHDADVLLTPHGFQSMALLFLPQPALLFEIFPYRSYKMGYEPLAKNYGLQHAAIMSPPLTWHRKFLLGLVSTDWCMTSKKCRKYARDGDVILTARGVQALHEAVLKKLEPALEAAMGSKGRDDLYSSP